MRWFRRDERRRRRNKEQRRRVEEQQRAELRRRLDSAKLEVALLEPRIQRLHAIAELMRARS